MIRKHVLRSVRKSAHITRRATGRISYFMGRIENKASRVLSGTDSSFGVVKSVPFEKIYYEKVPYITPLHPSLPQKGRRPCVTLLIPSLGKGSFFGGTATALIVAGKLANKTGKDLRIVQTLKHGNADVATFLKREGIELTNPIHYTDVSARTYNLYGYLDLHPEDVLVASAWWDAYLLNKLPLTKKFVYLVQDYEPIFYNNSDQYVLAESTYHMDNFIPLCNTKLMHDFMKSHDYINVAKDLYFEPAVSQYRKTTVKKSGKKTLFLYGRPNVERNLFFAAVNGIDECFMQKHLDLSEWDIVMAGQDSLPTIQLNSGATIKNLGKMDMDGYISMMQNVSIAVSPMMAPHPNYPTLEFASIGSMVVTTRYDIKQDLSHYSKNIIMADLNATSICGAIAEAARRIEDDEVETNPPSNVSNNWDKALSGVLTKVVKAL